MANITGKIVLLTQLATFWTKVKAYYQSRADKVDGIEEGAQVNKLEQVKLNGTALTITDKSVNVTAVQASDIVLETAASPAEGYLKTYNLKVAGTVKGTIDIPKDLVVTGGSIVTGTWNGNTFTPSASGTGKALALSIANQADPVYINVADLVDAFTVEAGAAKVQLAISATNEISATIVAGSIAKTDLTTEVQTSLGKADTALQEADLQFATDADINGLFA